MQMEYHNKDKMLGHILYITDYKVLCIFRTSTIVTGWSDHQSISMCPTTLPTPTNPPVIKVENAFSSCILTHVIFMFDFLKVNFLAMTSDAFSL